MPKFHPISISGYHMQARAAASSTGASRGAGPSAHRSAASLQLARQQIDSGLQAAQSQLRTLSSHAAVQEAGATPVLELAFTLADGLEYIRWAGAICLPGHLVT
jgi:methylmalonyl-CoA mutase N-terminal domain/subunit